jgi:hypothetical protein
MRRFFMKILKYTLSVFYVILIVFSCEKKAPTESEAPTPVITGIEPDTGFGGDIVVITGQYFNPEPSENIITFGGYHSTRAYDGTETMLKAIAPNVGGMELVTVKVNVIRVDCTHWSNALEFTFPPIISIFRDDFNHVRGIEFDEDGNCYACDADDGVVYKITPAGDKTVYANVSAKGDIAFDRDGYLYVCAADWENAIYRIPPGGGDPEVFTDEIGPPFSLDWDENGNMYVIGNWDTHVWKITPGGEITTLVDVENGGDVKVFEGYLYWSDKGDWGSGANSIMKAEITPGGIGTPEIVYEDPDWSEGIISGPQGINIDIEGNVYAVSGFWDPSNPNLAKINTDGTAEVFVELPTSNNKYIAFFGKYVYITTQWEGVIHKVYVGVEGAPPYAWGP